ncbi:Linear gramicidin synthase subunit D [Rhodococcus ruber]
MSVDGSGDRRPDDTRGRRPARQRPSRRRGPRAALLPQLLAAAVERDPAAAAVVFEDRTLSYGELDSASSRLARLLIRRGIGPEDVVAVASTRSIESVLSVWAVAKAGAAFVPVDPNYPEDRVRHMIDDSGARAGLTLTASVPDLPGSVPWIALDSTETRAALAEQSAAPVALDDRVRTLRAEHPAYVIYTSGSTGRPKGVVVTHTGLEGFCAEQVERYALTPASRTLHFASPSFDASVLELLLAVGAGSTMVIAPPSVYGGEDLAELLRSRQVTHAFVTPAALASVDPAGLDTLAMVVVGGEACPPDLVARWAPGRRFFNGYGPTETTIMTNISHALQPGEQVTIGRAIRGMTAHVLDERLNPVPAGVVGELYLEGPGLARGYHRRAALTAERFVAGVGGTRLYRTGDLVRSGEAGLIYMGRNDFQVKIRGFRIELGEIDAALAAHPDADFAVTVGREAPSGEARLVSYVHPVPGADVDPDALTEFVSHRLPAHMVPAVIVPLDRIPLTPVGKLDRSALPEPELPTHEYRAPRSATEQAVAEVFTELLGAERAGLDDDFFELGGNSLVATRAAARLGERLATRVPARLLFEASTVEGLAALVEPSVGAGAQQPLVAGPRPDPIPLSLAQQRMWFLNRFDPASAANNIPVALRVRGALDVDALRRALADVVARHEVLRTVYPEHDGIGSQLILPPEEAAHPLDPVPTAPDEIAAAVARLATAGFDVTSEVPLRVELLRSADDEHVLVVVVHHIAADGASIAPFVRDLVTAYVARSGGAAPAWEPLAVQYADYALWQRAVLGDESDPASPAAREIEFWRGALADLPDRLDLPADRPRPVEASGRGATVDFEVDAALHEAVEAAAQATGTSAFMVVHAALAVLLSRLSGTADIAIGTPVAGRGERALDDLVGMFVNTLVLRTRVEPDATFAELLGRVRDVDLAAFDNAELPFERLVEVLDPVRSAGHHPLFQVALFFQNLDRAEVTLPDVEIESVDLGGAVAKFDLQLTVSPREEVGKPAGMSAQFTYATDLFDESTVQGFAGRLIRLLAALAAGTGRVVGDLDLLDTAEHRALAAGNDRAVHPVRAAGLLAAYRDAVARRPDAAAVVFGDETLTYAQFDARVNRLARYLVGLGVGPETLVALAIRRSVDLPVAIYAVVAAGGAYVPLDPDHPADRIGHILSTARPVCVLSTRADAADLPGTVAPVLVDDLDLRGYAPDPIRDDELAGPIRPGTPAYVIFTSGSTGRPKGVCVSHEAIVNQLEWMAHEYEIAAGDVYLQKTATTFDVSLWGWFLPLRAGATLVVATHDGHRDPVYVAETIARHGVTLTDFVPSMLSVFAAHAPAGTCSTLRHVFVIGEALPPETVDAFRRVCAAAVHNLYGPTEAAVSVTYWPAGDEQQSVPIGVPEWNVRVYVLDGRLHPVPVGVPGELYLAGVQLARGYVGRPDLTADRFVADPLGAPGARMYRTGDLVRWRRTASGEQVLDYIGRTDFQVKFRGQRIELGEIESALLAQPTVGQAVALVVPTVTGEQLVGYVVPAPGATVETAQLLGAVAETLPAYMVPSALVVLDAFPLNASGKLDRKALPEPVFETRGFRGPRTPVEEIVAGVFADVLGLDRVGLDDDFFALGGNSLVATQVAARLGAALDTKVAVRVLFETPGVEALATRVESEFGRTRRVALCARPRPEIVPLSLAQQRMWFLNRFDPDSAVNNLPLAIRLRGNLDVEALRAAIDDVVFRHESLRTVYPEADGVPRQVVLPTADPAAGLEPEPVSETGLAAAVAAEIGAGFDVTTGVPLRLKLFRLSSREHVLVVVLHHISGDGFSMGPLTRDVMLAYAARAAGREPDWAPPAIQYADYALWQREVLGAEDDPRSVLAQQLGYWRRTLSGIPDQLDLPTDRPRPPVASNRGALTGFSIDAGTHAALAALARAHGVTLFMVVHAALATVLARLSGTEDIVIGTPVAGRGEAELDDVIGMFVNTLVLRTPVGPGDTFAALLGRVRETDLEAFGHADVPFERIVEVLDPERSQARHPLFQIALSFQNLARTRLELPGLTVEPVDFDVDQAKFDLQVTVSDVVTEDGEPDGLSVALTYATDLFDAGTMESFAQRFTRVLTAVAADPATVVGDIPLLPDEERATVLEAWNSPGTRAADGTLVGRFQAQAHRTPDAVAVTAGGRSLTYGELASRVNRLARTLIDRGVRPDTLVAVALPRTEELVVGLLAVLQAGGAYLPLDLTYPADRLEFMLRDAAPVCVLVSGTDREALPDSAVEAIDVSALELSAISDAPVGDDERQAPLRGDNLAYVIYTSGSTGRPKGVQVPHRTVLELFENTWSAFEFGEHDVWTMFHSYAFDFSVWELWGPLLHGGRLVVVDHYTSRSPEDFRAMLAREQVTVLNQTPSAFYQLAEADRAAADGGGESGLPALRYVIFGGEALDLRQLAGWYTRHAEDAPRLVNMYGITETTVHVSHLPLAAADTALAASVIGRGIPGLGIYVLDARLQPVPVGVPGEMYVRGAQLTRGYLGRADLTSGRFVADPFGAPGTRMYRTGDIARWNAHGMLEYAGRSDSQVQLRGFRIELGEIEAALTGVDGVAQAVAVVRTDERTGDRLVGYVVPRAGRDLDPAAVLDSVARFLTGYMVPDAIVMLEALPLTANGKLDRKALPAPVFKGDKKFRAPGTAAEIAIAEVFAEVLGVERIGADDSFFALGGDSIVSIQLVSRAKARGVVFTPRDVFERKTVAGLAEVARVGAEAAAPALAELPGGGVGDIPLTPIVRYMVERGGRFDRYTQTLALELPAGIDRDGVVGTLTAVLDRHDMLRARLRRNDSGDWELSTTPPGSVDVDALVTRVEVAAGTDEQALADLAARALDEAESRLRPAEGVVLQFVWLDPGAARTGRLVVVAHHLVVDGVSWRILVPDLVTAWAQLSNGGRPELQPVGTSFRRWAHALAETAVPARSAELGLWRSIVEGPDPLLGARPFDPAVDLASTVDKVRIQVDPATTDALLTTLPARFHGGVNDALLAALALAVARWRRDRGVDEPSALVRLEGHGREEEVVPGADLGRTVGWFTTMYPVRLDLSGVDLDDAFAGGRAAGTAIKAVKENLRAVPDKGIGYGLLRYLDPAAGAVLGSLPAGQISFNYLGRIDAGEIPEGAAGLGWLPAGDLGDLSGRDDADAPAMATIDINAVVIGGRLGANIGYASGLLGRDDVEELAQLWVRALEALAAHAARPDSGGLTPSDVPLVHVGQSDLDTWETRYPTLVDAWPLAPLQSGLLFHAMLADGRADVYTTQVLLHLTGRVDVARLRRAAEALLERHPNLRTAFVAGESGEPVQLVLDAVALPWREVDSPGADGSELESTVRADQDVPFDMAAPPLIRFLVVRTAPDAWTLAVSSHHILLDGWSMPLLLKDLLTLYATDADATILPRVPAYRSYLEWLATRDHVRSRQAWADALAGLEEPAMLAEVLGDGETGAAGGAEHRVAVDADTTAALTEYASRIGVTVNTVLQAAWAVLLARSTGRDDVVFGTTVSGRPAGLDGVESMVGLFINTIPVRVRLDPDTTVDASLRALQAEQADLLDHHHIGLAEIQQLAGTGALFDTLLVYESYPIDRSGLEQASSIDGMIVAGVNTRDATHYPLTVVATAEESLTFGFKYRRDVFTASTVQVLAQRYLRVLGGFVAGTAGTTGQLEILGDAERDDLVRRTGGPAEPAVPLADLLSAAARDPQSPALSYDGRELTYAELDARSSRLARLLIARGVGPEDVVAVGLTRSFESVVSVWAVAKTGAAYVPVDPNYPADRVLHMVTDSGARTGLTVAAERTVLPDTIPWVVLDDDGIESELDALSTAPVTDRDRLRPLRVDNPAYVIYTSGSTGLPKGVVVTHTGLANFAAEQHERYALGPATRALHFASPSFDASVLELLLAVEPGATLVIAPPTVYGGADLADLLRRERVTHAFVTPAALASVDPAGLDDLRTVVVGGEACPPELVARWAPGRAFHNGYGPTETTIMTNISDPLTPGGPITIGGPLRGTRSLVLDGRLRPVPVGVAGELYLSGVQLARGYHARASLTAARFVADPYGTGNRLYRTGDVVRWTESGEIEYVGRSDFQVKIRGFRIELGEIDAVLRRDPSVDFAVTVGRTSEAGVVRLVSYVTARPSATVGTAALLASAARALPGHMVPSSIVVLDDVPLTPVGKLDREALPEPDTATRPYRAPETEVQRVVADMFAEVLGLDRVGLDDDFFELGGNSLVATQVVARLRDVLGVQVRVPWLLAAPTVAAFAARLGGGVGEDAALAVVLPLRAGEPDVTPLFCIHPMIGLAWPYAALAARLAPGRPVFGLQTPALTDPGFVPTSIEALARRYADEIVRVRPGGPYRLAGWSLGGVLAHAVAVELQARGLRVEHLAMLDCIPRIDTDRFGAEFAENLRSLGVDVDPEALRDGLPPEAARAVAAAVPAELIDLDAQRVQRIFATAVLSPELINRHEPGLFAGDVAFFSARDEHPSEADAANLWAPHVTGRVRNRFVPGAHGAMMDPPALDVIVPELDRDSIDVTDVIGEVYDPPSAR